MITQLIFSIGSRISTITEWLNIRIIITSFVIPLVVAMIVSRRAHRQTRKSDHIQKTQDVISKIYSKFATYTMQSQLVLQSIKDDHNFKCNFIESEGYLKLFLNNNNPFSDKIINLYTSIMVELINTFTDAVYNNDLNPAINFTVNLYKTSWEKPRHFYPQERWDEMRAYYTEIKSSKSAEDLIHYIDYFYKQHSYHDTFLEYGKNYIAVEQKAIFLNWIYNLRHKYKVYKYNKNRKNTITIGVKN
jgi:hypothetical protein